MTGLLMSAPTDDIMMAIWSSITARPNEPPCRFSSACSAASLSASALISPFSSS